MQQYIRIVVLFLFGFIAETASAEMVADSNSAYFAGERFDIVISAPKGFRLITEAAQADGYACAIVPEHEEYATASLMLAINFFRIRGMSFERAVSQDTANYRSIFGPKYTVRPTAPLIFSTGDTLQVFQLSGSMLPMNDDFMSYFNAGTDLMIFESSRTTMSTAADSEKLLRYTTALAKVLTRAAHPPASGASFPPADNQSH